MLLCAQSCASQGKWISERILTVICSVRVRTPWKRESRGARREDQGARCEARGVRLQARDASCFGFRARPKWASKPYNGLSVLSPERLGQENHRVNPDGDLECAGEDTFEKRGLRREKWGARREVRGARLQAPGESCFRWRTRPKLASKSYNGLSVLSPQRVGQEYQRANRDGHL